MFTTLLTHYFPAFSRKISSNCFFSSRVTSAVGDSKFVVSSCLAVFADEAGGVRAVEAGLTAVCSLPNTPRRRSSFFMTKIAPRKIMTAPYAQISKIFGRSPRRLFRRVGVLFREACCLCCAITITQLELTGITPRELLPSRCAGAIHQLRCTISDQPIGDGDSVLPG